MSRSPKHLHGVPEPDPFTSEDGYSLEELITPACDDKGHITQKRLAFRPEVFPLLGQIVASGQFDYRSPEDIVRDAVYHRVWYLAQQLGVTFDKRKWKLNGEIRHVVTSAARQAEVERMTERRAAQEKYVEALASELEACRQSRNQAAFQVALTHAQLRLEEDWLDEPYRVRIQAVVDRAGRETW